MFSKLGIVWTENKGVLLVGPKVRHIKIKPKFSFDYDSLYCEPNLSHFVLNDKDYLLSNDQINEVLQYLAEEEKKPAIINGIDKFGKFLKDIEETKAFAEIHSIPPPGVWRIDISRLPEEHWYQPHCTDKEGNYLYPAMDEEEVALIVPFGPPKTEYGEVWKWNKKTKNWFDSRSNTEILAYIKANSIYEKHLDALYDIENSYIDVRVNSNEYKINIDTETKSALQDVILSGSSNVVWFFKGSTIATSITLKQAKSILADIIEARQKIMDQYFAHKAAISLIDDIETLKNY